MTILLLLIRHGLVDVASRGFRRSPRGRQWDPGLGREGREQAASLGARLATMDRPSVLVTSPFTRCLETVAPFVEATGLQPDVDEDLGEVFGGAWEGLSFEEIVSKDEELARRFRDQEAMFSMAPGGESGADLRARVVPAIERALARARQGTVIAVVHGGVINAYLGHVMGIRQDMFYLPENTSINTVLADGDHREMRFLNDVRHLTDPGLFVAPPDGPRS